MQKLLQPLCGVHDLWERRKEKKAYECALPYLEIVAILSHIARPVSPPQLLLCVGPFLVSD